MLVKEIMTPHPVVAEPDMPVTRAERLMKESNIRHLPVIGEGKGLVGLITRDTLNRAFPSELTTLTIWETYNDEEHPVFKEIVDQFKEAHPGTTIDLVRLPHAGAEPKIQTALTTRTEPDIARVDGSFLAKLAHKNALLELSDRVPDEFLADLLPVALASCRYRRGLWGLPDQTNGLCLFYNKDLFRKAGLDPERPPKTWDELSIPCR